MKKYGSLLSAMLAVLIVMGAAFVMPIGAAAATSDLVVTAEEAGTGEPAATEPQETSVPETTAPIETTAPTTAPAETTEPATVPVPTPKAISGLTVAAKGTDYISIRWNKSSDATGYIVERAEETKKGKFGAYKTYPQIGIDSVAVRGINLKAGTLYKFRVYAVNQREGTIAKSKSVAVITMTNPADVKTFKVKKTNATAAKLAWTKSASATKYVLYRAVEQSDGSFSEFKKVKSLKDATTYKDTGLTKGNLYKYKLCVYRKQGDVSAYSEGKTALAQTTVNAPKKIVLKKASSTALKLKWSKVAHATGYQLYRLTSKGYKKVKTLKTNTFTEKKLKSGKTYYYKARAYRKVSGTNYFSDFTSAIAATTTPSIPSAKDVTVKTYLRRGLFTWSAVSGASGYDIYVLKNNGSWKYLSTTSYPRYLTSKLTVGRTYTFSIRPYSYANGSKVYGASKNVNVNAPDTAYGMTVSGTWVEVCTETQTMYMYVDNKLYVQTPVVTGNAGALATNPGYHKVISRKSPAILHGSYNGQSWNTRVSYWLGFTANGQGIHDSTWRTSGYGGEIYKGNGSHGCVNTPLNAAAKIYAKAYIGMPVVVY